MLIQRATLLDGRSVDIRVAEKIVAVEPELAPVSGEPVYDAAGRTVIPGLHDHHVHLRSAAAALGSVRVGPAEVHNRAELARALATAKPGADGWVRAVGYHEAVAGPLDRTVLDEVVPSVPVRVQHRSGVLWTLNSAGLVRVGMADHPDGRLRSADRSWSDTLQRNETGLGEVSERLSGLGVTGVTDATPDLEIDDIVRLLEAHRRGELPQRVLCLAPGKRILHDTDLDLDGLTSWISERHGEGAPVAVHCVTAAQLVVTLSALQATGTHPGDRIEHASVVPDDGIGTLAASGVTVVTQPNFVAERGDQYLDEVPAGEHHELWRVGSLLRAGVPLVLSTDMPFGEGDPWATMRAAVRRMTGSGAVLGADERITAPEALGMFFGTGHDPLRRRTVAPGQPGDLVVLEPSPSDVLETLASDMVAATVIAGEVAFDRG
ncbi:amidohydrolase [Mycolicibacterium acapulense]|uniref:Amidohydrolase n=1 Tax=Mycobacterium lehmannii TaxID=2048550 RepID=A0A117JHJ5_9MYCO|nr:amidohydrolase family protein [Mycobacterium lehmannii]KUI00314.1 amidohydrolase [Mycolicibacterium acapulense]KUI05117.1 amidohydrolase [Mycolicibacterium acapulense]KUI07268.1 amidohydrolase [Mycobacterium lehmannii]KUI15559.1 amidohydrolase [Mycolicibacterium acapulense]